MHSKRTICTIAAFSLTLGGSLLVATPASAAERTFGAINCSQGSIRTQAYGNYSQRHYLTQGATVYAMTLPNSGTNLVTRTWYSGKVISARGGVQNTGTITSASQACAD